jgi:hypothetical protein
MQGMSIVRIAVVGFIVLLALRGCACNGPVQPAQSKCAQDASNASACASPAPSVPPVPAMPMTFAPPKSPDLPSVSEPSMAPRALPTRVDAINEELADLRAEQDKLLRKRRELKKEIQKWNDKAEEEQKNLRGEISDWGEKSARADLCRDNIATNQKLAEETREEYDGIPEKEAALNQKAKLLKKEKNAAEKADAIRFDQDQGCYHYQKNGTWYYLLKDGKWKALEE